MPASVEVNTFSIAVSCACESAIGTADKPVLLPMTVLAGRFAIFGRVTAPLLMVVATVPAVVVTSPVSVGKFAAG